MNGRCGGKDEDTPLVALTNHLLIGTTERQIQAQEVEPFDSREALHSVLTAKLDGVPRLYDMFVIKKDGCIYDFVYVASPSAAEAGRREFERLIRAVHLVPEPL